MKYLLLSIFVMFAAPPLQASFCDMCMDHSESQQRPSANDTHHDMSHDMNSGQGHNPDHQPGSNMGIGMGDGMAHDMGHDSDNQNMDCCDDESAATDDSCGMTAHCGANAASLAILSIEMRATWFGVDTSRMSAQSQLPSSQFSSPPFRPPIS